MVSNGISPKSASTIAVHELDVFIIALFIQDNFRDLILLSPPSSIFLIIVAFAILLFPPSHRKLKNNSSISFMTIRSL